MADNTIALRALAPVFETPVEAQTKVAQLRALQDAGQMNALELQGKQTAMTDDASARAAIQADPTGGQGYLAAMAGSGNYKGFAAGQKAGLDAAKTKAETKHTEAQANETQMRAINEAFTAHRDQLNTVNTPDDAAAWVSAGFKDPLTAPILLRVGDEAMAVSRIPKDPAEFAKWKAQAGLSANEYVKHTTVSADAAAGNKVSTENNKRTNETSRLNNRDTIAGENTRATESNRVHLLAAGLDKEGNPTADVSATVKAIGEYRQAPPTLQALRNPRMAAVMDQVNAQYPGFDATQYGARQGAAKAFATGKDGQAVESANTALNHLETLEALAKAQKNGDFQLFNKLANTLGANTGATAPTNLQAAITMVAPEIVKAVVGAGGGVEDRAKAGAALNPNFSPDQFLGASSTMKELFGGRLSEKARTYKRTTGRDDFDKVFLSPAAQEVLSARKGKAGASATPATNAKGWALHKDAQGNSAYVSPDGTQYEEVK